MNTFSVKASSGIEFKYFDKEVLVDISDLEAFKQMVTTQYHAATTFKKKRRNQKSFETANGITIDFDQKNGAMNSSIEDFKNSAFAARYSCIIYTSKSHRKPGCGDCFHVFIPFSETITSADAMIRTLTHIHEAVTFYGLQYDVASLHGYSRAITPSFNNETDPSLFEMYKIDRDLFPVSNELYELPATSKTIMDQYEYRYENDFDCSFFYGDAFNMIGSELRNSHIMEIARTINKKNRLSNWTFFTKCSDWHQIGACFHNLLGLENGRRAFHALSTGFIKKDGTMEAAASIDSMYDSIAMSNTHIFGYIKLMDLVSKYEFRVHANIVAKVISKINPDGSGYDVFHAVKSELMKLHGAESINFSKMPINPSDYLLDSYGNVLECKQNRDVIYYTYTVAGKESELIKLKQDQTADLINTSGILKTPLHRKFLFNAYGLLSLNITKVINPEIEAFKKLNKLVQISSRRGPVIHTSDLMKLIADINKTYSIKIPSLIVNKEKLIKKLFERGFITTDTATSYKINRDKRIAAIIVTKELSGKKALTTFIEGVKSKDTKRFMDKLNNTLAGITSTDVVYTITDKPSKYATKRTDETFVIHDMFSNGEIGEDLSHRVALRDQAFIRLLKEYSLIEDVEYYLELHWGSTRPDIAKSIRRARTKKNQQLFLNRSKNR